MRPWEMELLTEAEIDEFVSRLRRMPPIGSTQMVKLEK